jgi:hypothetical protein
MIPKAGVDHDCMQIQNRDNDVSNHKNGQFNDPSITQYPIIHKDILGTVIEKKLRRLCSFRALDSLWRRHMECLFRYSYIFPYFLFFLCTKYFLPREPRLLKGSITDGPSSVFCRSHLAAMWRDASVVENVERRPRDGNPLILASEACYLTAYEVVMPYMQLI